MKFRATRADLASAVADAARALPSRPAMPTLNAVRVTASADDGEVEIVGFDFDVCVRATLPAVVIEGGVTLVRGRVFADSLAAMPHGEVSVEQVDARLEVKMPKVRYGLRTIAPEDYPALPATPPALGTFDVALLTAALARASVAARPVIGLAFTGAVHLAASPAGLVLSATDRYTVASVTVEWQDGGPEDPVEAVVSAKGLADALKGMTGEVTLCIDDGGIAVLGAERSMSSRKLEFEFPPCEAIIVRLAEPTTRLQVRADHLAEAMSRAARVVARNRAPVRLAVSKDEGLTYDAASDDNDEVTGEVAVAELEGDPIVVGVNPVYLADALKAAGPDVVEIGFRGSKKPLTVTSPARPGDVHVVMPVSLPS